jgi:hypothetical protein
MQIFQPVMIFPHERLNKLRFDKIVIIKKYELKVNGNKIKIEAGFLFDIIYSSKSLTDFLKID